MNHRVEINDLQFSYNLRRAPAVDLPSLHLASGIHFVVGSNGSGKSTLLRILAGILVPQFGSTTFDHTPLPRSGAERQGIAPTAYLKQDHTLRGRTSSLAFLQYSLWMHGISPSQIEARSIASLRAVGLDEMRETPIGRLSGGMQRRLGLAAEVAHDPRLVLLDEPTSGLDHEAREAVHNIVSSLAEAGAVVVISSHDESEIDRYSSAVHVMSQGRVIKTVHNSPGGKLSLANIADISPLA
ncbi:ATP-binding cassette domain-containing protein [Cellulomonas sp. 179-A 4D5 NHS]|uniref:ATP-binding cassette domain-containing protein n=1 Tax=Cellulomonas sp. 179-A 4D5 NHS TaxID=3142378 RepID=UPI00399F6403